MKSLSKNRFVQIAGTFLTIGLLHSIVESATLSKKCIGYYISWGMYAAHKNFKPENIPWTKITHINYAFAEINSGTWTIQGTDVWADHQVDNAGQIGKINEMKKAYGVKTLISVGGWTRSGNFSAMAATESGRTAFANDCVRFIRAYKFDGVDIDWEYPGNVRSPDYNLLGDQGCPGKIEDMQNFTLLLKKLRESLDTAAKNDNATYFLSIAAPGGYDKIEGPEGFQEPDKYHQYIDWINVMSYDFHGGWDTVTSHHTALTFNPKDKSSTSPINIKERYNSQAILNYYLSKGVPSAKMNIGVGYYARSWKNVPDSGTLGLFQKGEGRTKTEGSWEFGTEGFYTVKPWESSSAYDYGYDTIAKAPYLYNKAEKIFYTYDNERSVGDKCDYVLKNSYGGAFFWDFTGDYPATGGSTLTSVIYSKFSQTRAQKEGSVSYTIRSASPVTYRHNKFFFGKSIQGEARVSVYTASGKKVVDFNLISGSRGYPVSLPSGLYFYTVKGFAFKNSIVVMP
jgi:chitinase